MERKMGEWEEELKGWKKVEKRVKDRKQIGLKNFQGKRGE